MTREATSLSLPRVKLKCWDASFRGIQSGSRVRNNSCRGCDCEICASPCSRLLIQPFLSQTEMMQHRMMCNRMDTTLREQGIQVPRPDFEGMEAMNFSRVADGDAELLMHGHDGVRVSQSVAAYLQQLRWHDPCFYFAAILLLLCRDFLPCARTLSHPTRSTVCVHVSVSVLSEGSQSAHDSECVSSAAICKACISECVPCVGTDRGICTAGILQAVLCAGSRAWSCVCFGDFKAFMP